MWKCNTKNCDDSSCKVNNDGRTSPGRDFILPSVKEFGHGGMVIIMECINGTIKQLIDNNGKTKIHVFKNGGCLWLPADNGALKTVWKSGCGV